MICKRKKYIAPIGMWLLSAILIVSVLVPGMTFAEENEEEQNWEAASANCFYSVAYDGNGISSETWSDNSIAEGSNYVVKDGFEVNITNDALSVVSWNTEPDGSGEQYFPGESIIVNGFTVLYAEWTLEPAVKVKEAAVFLAGRFDPDNDVVEIIYNWEGGNSVIRTAERNKYYQIEDGLSFGAGKDGYNLIGWKDTNSPNADLYEANKFYLLDLDEDDGLYLHLFAVYEPVQGTTFNVTYSDNNNQEKTYSMLEYNTMYKVLEYDQVFSEVPNSTFVFFGWNSRSDNGGTPYNPGAEIKIESDVFLYAQWKRPDEQVAIIPYYDESYVDLGENNVKVPLGEEVQVRSPESFDYQHPRGHKFLGWINLMEFTNPYDPDFTEEDLYQPGDRITVTEQGQYIFRGVWEYDGLYIIYDGNGGALPDEGESSYSVEAPFGPYDVEDNKFVNGDKEFTGWNTERNGGGQPYSAEQHIDDLQANLTLYAQWKDPDAAKYDVTYHGNGGYLIDGSGAEFYTIPVDAGSKHVIGGNRFVHADDTLVFDGWSSEPNGAGTRYTVGQEVSILDDVDFYAVWESGHSPDDYYHITYHGNEGGHLEDGASSYTVDIPKGTAESAAALTDLNAFINDDDQLMFIGWNTQANGDDGIWYDQGQRVTIRGDMDLYARWGDKNEYTDVIYHSNGGRLSGTTDRTTYIQTVKRNSEYRARANMFVYSGYNFQNWSTTSGSGGTPYNPGQQVPTDTATVNLYAQWKSTDGNGNGGGGGGGNPGSSRSAYDVIYHANNGTDEADIKESYAPNATVTTKAGSVFTAPGDQVFRGWATSASGEVVYLAAETFSMPSRDVNLYAVWEQLLSYDDHFAYIVGYEDGTVGPGRNVTREEVATIFYRLLTDEARSNYRQTTNRFPDVTEDRWSNIAISTLTNARIVSGYDDGTFKPGNAVTRAELAVIAAIFDNSPDTDEDLFSDIAGHWAGPYINRAALRGWVSGYEDGTYLPANNITRAELVTLVNKVLRREPKDSSSLLPDMATFVDNMDTTQWYYLAIQEAANSHDYDADGSKEIWTELRTNRDWLQLERP